jgi:hypothetical protein
MLKAFSVYLPIANFPESIRASAIQHAGGGERAKSALVEKQNDCHVELPAEYYLLLY